MIIAQGQPSAHPVDAGLAALSVERERGDRGIRENSRVAQRMVCTVCRCHAHQASWMRVCPAKPESRAPWQRASIAFSLYDHVIQLLRTFQEELMGCFRRDADPVSGGNLIAKAALNRAVALLVRCDGLSVDQGAADEKCGGTRLHQDDVRLRLMPFDLPVPFPTNQKNGLVGEIGKLLNREMVGIGRCLFQEFVGTLLE